MESDGRRFDASNSSIAKKRRIISRLRFRRLIANMIPDLGLLIPSSTEKIP
jgi:hypothetical protein